MFKRKAVNEHSEEKTLHALKHVKFSYIDENEDNTHESESVLSASTLKHSDHIYGNYPSYFGYKFGDKINIDPRYITLFQGFKHLFYGKRILDIGCNVGDLTIQLAKNFQPEYLLGIDIDSVCIQKARKNLHLHYDLLFPMRENRLCQYYQHNKNDSFLDEFWKDNLPNQFFPISMPINYGNIPMVLSEGSEKVTPFPFNVHFKCSNWIDYHQLDISLKESIDLILW